MQHQLHLLALAALGLSACEATPPTAASGPASQQITEAAQFSDMAVGQPLYFGQDYLLLQPDGQVSGDFGGQPLTGTWEWRGGAFCRTLSSAQGPAEDCQVVEVAEQGLRFTRERGAGNSFIYTMEPTSEPL